MSSLLMKQKQTIYHIQVAMAIMFLLEKNVYYRKGVKGGREKI